MRLGLVILLCGAGLALAGCGSTKPITASSGQTDSGQGLVTLPLSVPPGYFAPPLEAPAANAPPGAVADQPAATTQGGQLPEGQPATGQPATGATATGETGTDGAGAGEPSTAGTAEATTLQPPGGAETAAAPSQQDQPQLDQPQPGQTVIGPAPTVPALTGPSLTEPSLTGPAATAPALADSSAGLAGGASGAGQTPGEQAFLQAAGANNADPNIRAQIDQAANNRLMNQALVEQLVFGPSTPPASATGPSVKRGSTGILDTLF